MPEFYSGDVVSGQLRDGATQCGIVERAHGDLELSKNGLEKEQVHVAWYPEGICQTVHQSELQLIDRSNLPRDIVRSTHFKQSGTVTEVSVECDLVVVGTKKRINRVNATSLRDILSLMENECIVYGAWLGRITEVDEYLVLRFNNGARAMLSVNSRDCDMLEDLYPHPSDDGSFCDENFQYYPGQTLVGPAKAFLHVQWLDKGVLPKTKKKKRIKALVEQIGLHSIQVEWLQRAAFANDGFSNCKDLLSGSQLEAKETGEAKVKLDEVNFVSRSEPPNILTEKDLKHVCRLLHFWHAHIDLGDRFMYRLTPTDANTLNNLKNDVGNICPKNIPIHHSYLRTPANPSHAACEEETWSTASDNVSNGFSTHCETDEDLVQSKADNEQSANAIQSKHDASKDNQVSRQSEKPCKNVSVDDGEDPSLVYCDANQTTKHQPTTGQAGVCHSYMHRHGDSLRAASNNLPNDIVTMLNSLSGNIDHSRPELQALLKSITSGSEISIPQKFKPLMKLFSSYTSRYETKNREVRHVEDLPCYRSLRNSFHQAKKNADYGAGQLIVVEVCCTRSLTSVEWQDASTSILPSTSLAPAHHVDEHDFCPGDFVSLDAAEGLEKYGVVLKVDNSLRMATIQWLRYHPKANEVELLDIEELSQYAVVDHKDFHFRLSDIVLRLSPPPSGEGANQQLIGELLRVTPSGTLLVKWSDMSESEVIPQEVILIDPDDGSSSATSSCSSDDGSWETAESGEEFTEDDEGEVADHKDVSRMDDAMEVDQEDEKKVHDLRSERSTVNLQANSQFLTSPAAPAGHSFAAYQTTPNLMKQFLKALNRDINLMRSSLPRGIYVKSYENRMDLMSVLIEGSQQTPYEDGIFLFDLQLPEDYPESPPTFHYVSHSHRLNPNLYEDGTVCISLLGTWSGKGNETWTSKSNLLQVLVSIQGLILNSEPYYNEAGYEGHRATTEGNQNSRCYNEMVLLRMVEHMTSLLVSRSSAFPDLVSSLCVEKVPRMVGRMQRLLAEENHGSNRSLESDGVVFKYPLKPLSLGVKLMIQEKLGHLVDVAKNNGLSV